MSQYKKGHPLNCLAMNWIDVAISICQIYISILREIKIPFFNKLLAEKINRITFVRDQHIKNRQQILDDYEKFVKDQELKNND